MNDMETIAKGQAGQYFKSGYNCAEAVLRSFLDIARLPADEAVLRATTGFGGGIGHAGCVCGALAASVMAIGMLTGRIEPTQSRQVSYELAAEFHQKFQDRFGGTCCRGLNPHPFETREHLVNCIKITGNSAALLAGFLQEKGLLPSEDSLSEKVHQ